MEDGEKIWRRRSASRGTDLESVVGSAKLRLTTSRRERWAAMAHCAALYIRREGGGGVLPHRVPVLPPVPCRTVCCSSDQNMEEGQLTTWCWGCSTQGSTLQWWHGRAWQRSGFGSLPRLKQWRLTSRGAARGPWGGGCLRRPRRRTRRVPLLPRRHCRPPPPPGRRHRR